MCIWDPGKIAFDNLKNWLLDNPLNSVEGGDAAAGGEEEASQEKAPIKEFTIRTLFLMQLPFFKEGGECGRKKIPKKSVILKKVHIHRHFTRCIYICDMSLKFDTCA